MFLIQYWPPCFIYINILFQAYEAEVRGRSGGAAKDVHHMLTTLKKSVSNASTTSTEGLTKTVAKPAKPATKVISKTKGKRAVQTGKKAIAPSARRGTAVKAKKATGRVVITASSESGNSNAQGALGRRVKQKQVHAKQSQTKRKKTTATAKPATITGAKTNKAKKHGPERLAQFKSKTSAVKRKKLRRERVPETNFALRDFPWSPWKIIASSEARKKIHPIYGAVGLKNRILEYTHSCAKFKGQTKQPVLYEFAVKPLGHRQKKIVYAKICPKNLSYSTHWRDILNSSKSLKKQIENIIRKQGGVIYFRRLVLKRYKRYENIPSIIENYDYVWAPETGAKKYRELICDSYVISEDMDVD